MLTHEAVIERALRYCDLAVAQGLLAIRSHVDVCDDRLLAVEALLEVKRQVAPYLDLQLVAFPQDGYYRSPHGRARTSTGRSTWASTSSAASRISSGPWRTAPRSVRGALRDRGRRAACMVDLHCDETDDPHVAPHRDAGGRDACASGSAAASPART